MYGFLNREQWPAGWHDLRRISIFLEHYAISYNPDHTYSCRVYGYVFSHSDDQPEYRILIFQKERNHETKLIAEFHTQEEALPILNLIVSNLQNDMKENLYAGRT